MVQLQKYCHLRAQAGCFHNGRVAGWVAVSAETNVTPKRVVKKYRDPFKKAKQVPLKRFNFMNYENLSRLSLEPLDNKTR